MKLGRILRLLWVVTLGVSTAWAQIVANGRMPPVIDMTRSGWDVSLQNGNLTFAIPLTVVPGELPIPVAFGMNGTYLSEVRPGPSIDLGGGKNRPTFDELRRPVVGAIHFGYISTPVAYGASSGGEDGPAFNGHPVEGLTVLENGSQIPDRDWTAFSAHAELGTILNLPQAYTFGMVSNTSAMVDPTARYLSYTTSADGLGATYKPIVQGLPLSGFGNPNPDYRVVLDKDRARVYAYAAALATWLPVLWADRFGHYVTFTWARSTSGFPAGSPSTLTALSSVTVTNQRSKGVVLRWSEYSSYYSSTSIQEILRLDYVGLDAPSLLVKGYPGPATVPPTAAPFRAYARNLVIVPSVVGALCRPTSIQVGPTSIIAQPVWTSPSGPGKPVTPSSPQADSQSPLQSWTFTYDSALAELSSCTDPLGVTTRFTYANYTSGPRGVAQVDSVDGNQFKRSMRWTRTFGSPMSVKLEGWWDPSQMATPDRYHLFTFPTNSLNNGNGVYQTDALIDSNGKTWSSTVYSYSPTGAGLNAGLSGVDSITLSRDGAPALITTFGYANTASKLQTTTQRVTAIDAGGRQYNVSSAVNTYASRWDMLEGRQLTQSVITRYKPDGVTALPAVTQKNVWDAPTSGQPLLQLQKSYLDAGATGRHGAAYAYDTQGRPSSVDIYHWEGSSEIASPNTQVMAYDAGSGMQASVTSTDNMASPKTSISQSQGGFDSWGRAATQTDAAGVVTTFTFDDRGRVTFMSRPGSPDISYTYPDELTAKMTVNGLDTISVYDGFHRLQSLTKPTGSGTSLTQRPTYDTYGRLVSLRETTSAGTTRNEIWAYDALDRLISHTPVAGMAIATSYAASGINSRVTTTLSNQVSSSTYTDPLGQVVRTDAPDGSVTTLTYDQFGNQTSVTIQPSSGTPQVRSFSYDALNRLTSKTEPETNTQTFSVFNALNQPTQVVEAAGTGEARIRTLAYDGFGRMRNVANGSDSLSQTFTGPNLTSATRTIAGTAVSQTFAYNGPGGRLSSETTSQPGLTSDIQYTYNAATGTLSSIAYPSGRLVSYSYDALGRATAISQNGATLVSTVNYDDWGNLAQIGYPSGSQDQWEADLTGTRLSKWSIGYSGGTPESRRYTYDDATNILKTTGDWSLTHDALGRMTQADGFGIKTAHTYDAFGNATSHVATPNGLPVPAAFNNFTFNPMANNQIPGLESNGALTRWNTNQRGEATQVGTATSSGQALGLGWDGLGFVKSVVWNAGSQNYLYAPSGMRVSVTDSSDASQNRQYAYSSTAKLMTEYMLSAPSLSAASNLWTGGSSSVVTVPSNGWAGVYQATIPCVPGDVFYGTAYVRTIGMTSGSAHVGIRFDSDTQIGIGWGQLLPDGTPCSTMGLDRIHVAIMGTAPAGATKVLLYIECGPCNPGAIASFDSICFSKGVPLSLTTVAAASNLWRGGSSAVVAVPSSGWAGVYQATMPCVPGDVFYGTAYVRAIGMTSGSAHVGIRFDSDTQNGIGWGQLLPDGTPCSTMGLDRIRVAIMGTAPAGATKALLYIECGSCNTGAIASYDSIYFSKGASIPQTIVAPASNLWVSASSAKVTVPSSGWVGVYQATMPCVPGDVFYGMAYVRTMGMTSGFAHVGIRFDSDTQNGIGWGQLLPDGTPDSTMGSDRIHVAIMGIAPAGATKILIYLECGPCNPGAMASFDSIAFSKGSLLSPNGSATRDVIYLGSRAVAEIDAAGVHELHSDHLGSPRLITKGSGTWPSEQNGTSEGTQAYGPYGELIQSTGYVPLTGYTGHIQTDASGLIYMRGRYYSPAWHAFVNSDHGVDPSTWNQRAYVGGRPFMATDPSGMGAAGQCGYYSLEPDGWLWDEATSWSWVWNSTDCGEGGNGGKTPGDGEKTNGGVGNQSEPQTPTQPNPCDDPLFRKYYKTIQAQWANNFNSGNVRGLEIGGWLGSNGFDPWQTDRSLGRMYVTPLPVGAEMGFHFHPDRAPLGKDRMSKFNNLVSGRWGDGRQPPSGPDFDTAGMATFGGTPQFVFNSLGAFRITDPANQKYSQIGGADWASIDCGK